MQPRFNHFVVLLFWLFMIHACTTSSLDITSTIVMSHRSSSISILTAKFLVTNVIVPDNTAVHPSAQYTASLLSAAIRSHSGYRHYIGVTPLRLHPCTLPRRISKLETGRARQKVPPGLRKAIERSELPRIPLGSAALFRHGFSYWSAFRQRTCI
jgi:hypothetical protein